MYNQKSCCKYHTTGGKLSSAHASGLMLCHFGRKSDSVSTSTWDVSGLCSADKVPMTEAMLAIGSASQLEFCTRAAGVEVLLSLAERAPAIMRKSPSVAPGLLPLALVLTCEVRRMKHIHSFRRLDARSMATRPVFVHPLFHVFSLAQVLLLLHVSRRMRIKRSGLPVPTTTT